MQCPRCQAENREGRRFCGKCAAPLSDACPSCGFSNEPGEDAVAVGRRALDLAHRQKERGNEAWVLRLLGDITAHRECLDLESAEGHYTQALARAEELGMRPLAAHCHLGLGKLYRRTGKQAQAQGHLVTATAMYREMDMGVWLEKAEAELDPPLRTHSKPGSQPSLLT